MVIEFNHQLFLRSNCISPNVGRYFGLVTGPPPAMEAMEAAMEAAAATERFRRWFVCLFVCEQYSGKTPRWISTKLGGGVRYGPRVMALNFGLGPPPPKKKLLEKIFFFLLLHFYMF